MSCHVVPVVKSRKPSDGVNSQTIWSDESFNILLNSLSLIFMIRRKSFTTIRYCLNTSFRMKSVETREETVCHCYITSGNFGQESTEHGFELLVFHPVFKTSRGSTSKDSMLTWLNFVAAVIWKVRKTTIFEGGEQNSFRLTYHPAVSCLGQSNIFER